MRAIVATENGANLKLVRLSSREGKKVRFVYYLKNTNKRHLSKFFR